MSEQSTPEMVSLEVAAEALADVLTGWDVPTNRIVVEFKRLVAEYVEMEA